MGGSWNIDHINIAEGAVRFIYSNQPGYFPAYISHVFAGGLGSFGTLNSELACEVSDCIFEFADQEMAGRQTLLTAYGENVLFRSCNFRYQNVKSPMLMQGDCVFQHCYFSGPIIKDKAGSFNNFFSVKNILLGVPLMLSLLGLTFIYYYRKQFFWKIYYAGKSKSMLETKWAINKLNKRH